MSEVHFDATEVEPNAPFNPLPPGDYPVMIVNSEMRPTKKGDGRYLWLEMEVLDGPLKGRHVWDRLNIDNPNAKAVEIAKRTLSAICRAVGVMQLTDSEQLHGKALLARVKTRPATDQHPAGNDIAGYNPIGNAPPAPTPQPAAAAAPAPATTGAAAGTAPWQR